MIVAPAAKNAASKIHPKDILHDKNHLYRILLTLNDLKQETIFTWLDIEFLITQNFISLPDHIRNPRRQAKHRTATILRQNNKLTSEMCLWGSNKCGASAPRSFYLPLSPSYSCSETTSMC